MELQVQQWSLFHSHKICRRALKRHLQCEKMPMSPKVLFFWHTCQQSVFVHSSKDQREENGVWSILNRERIGRKQKNMVEKQILHSQSFGVFLKWMKHKRKPRFFCVFQCHFVNNHETMYYILINKEVCFFFIMSFIYSNGFIFVYDKQQNKQIKKKKSF